MGKRRKKRSPLWVVKLWSVRLDRWIGRSSSLLGSTPKAAPLLRGVLVKRGVGGLAVKGSCDHFMHATSDSEKIQRSDQI
jgi:hypothetical protein